VRLNRTTLVTGTVLIGSVALAMLLGSQREGSAAVEEGPVPVAVRAETFARRALVGEVAAGGFLRARGDVTVSAERAGRLVALPFAEGAHVDAGAEIATLDDRHVAADLEQARTALREAELDPRLPAAELAAAHAALERAEDEFSRHHPRAPISGVVEVHHVDVGEVVGPGTPLLDIVDLTELVLDVDVDAEVVPSLAIGAEVAMSVQALGEAGQCTGRITRIASRADPGTRRFRVEVGLPLVDGDAAVPRPGMFAEACFTLPAGAPAFYVPKSVVRQREGEDGVYVVEGGHAGWCPVRIEEVAGHPRLYRVIEGAPPDGSVIVVAGFSGLRAGMAVEVAQ